MHELQSALDALHTERSRLQQEAEQKVSEISAQHEAERKQLRVVQRNLAQSLRREVEDMRTKLHAAEEREAAKREEAERTITEHRLEAENRIRGLLPLQVQRELEETIVSLQSQVGLLQQRCSLLQEEIDSQSRGSRLVNGSLSEGLKSMLTTPS